MDSYSGLGDDLESSISMYSVGGKAAAVQREHPLGFKLFSQDSQSGVREIHRDVMVLFHQNRDAFKTFHRRRHQLKGTSEDKLKTSFLRPPTRPDQVKRFDQHRFRGNDGASPFLQRGNAVIVQLLVTVHERHKGPCIKQQFSGHGATAGSSTRDGADPNRADRWQHCREDRVHVRSDAFPAGCPDIVPKPRVLLPNACALSAWLTALIWWRDPPAIAWLIGVPYQGFPFALQCSAMTCKCKTQRANAQHLG